MDLKSPLPEPTRSNIERIMKLEQAQDEQITAAQRISTFIADYAGSVSFVVAQIAFALLWILLNTLPVSPIAVFDPPPFNLLWGLLAFESVLLTAFVLIRQNHMSRKAEHRSQLDLQVNLLSEQAITKVIQMLARMSEEMGIASRVNDAEADALAEKTAIESLSEELRENLAQKKDSLAGPPDHVV
jgi:uncharacterized membrane protein